LNLKLPELPKNASAEIMKLNGGKVFRMRLESMGIREGKILKVVSAQVAGGPVTVSVDGRCTSMGRGLASRIEVSPVRQKDS
jgi:ferrous iron transport protein A